MPTQFCGSRGPLIAAVAVVLCWTSTASASLITQPTSSWTAITYSGPNQYDYAGDQQTGDHSSDITGDSSNPALYMLSDPGTSGSSTDGTLFFRARLGTAGAGNVFDRNLFVGLDANGDGALDLYVGVHNQGSADELAIYGPGSGANVSPNTTTISGPDVSYTETALNYHYAAVDTPTTDVDGDGNTDFFLSFGIPFADIVAQLAVQSIGIDDTTDLAFVLATATQDNSFNQDVNGLPKNYDNSATWSDLGALSDPIAPAAAAVPEPHSLFLMGLSVICGFGLVRQRRLA